MRDKILILLQEGEVVPVSVNVGDKVMLPEYGGTKVVLEEKVRNLLYTVLFLDIRLLKCPILL